MPPTRLKRGFYVPEILKYIYLEDNNLKYIRKNVKRNSLIKKNKKNNRRKGLQKNRKDSTVYDPPAFHLKFRSTSY